VIRDCSEQVQTAKMMKRAEIYAINAVKRSYNEYK
jgi:hypothetical protein